MCTPRTNRTAKQVDNIPEKVRGLRPSRKASWRRQRSSAVLNGSWDSDEPHEAGSKAGFLEEDIWQEARAGVLEHFWTSYMYGIS